MNAGQEKIKPKKGVKRQLFGCALLSLAILNSALTLKSNGAPDAFIYLFACAGVVFLISGLVASRK